VIRIEKRVAKGDGLIPIETFEVSDETRDRLAEAMKVVAASLRPPPWPETSNVRKPKAE